MAKDFFKIDKGISYGPQATAPTSPQNGDSYYDLPTQKFRFYQNGLWQELGGGSGGSGSGINYLALDPTITWNFEDNNVSGWATYANAAPAALPEVSPGGTPNVNFTFAPTATLPLRQVYSGLITKDAANRQGHGIRTSAFSIDRMDVGQTLFLNFDFEGSTNYVAGDLSVYLSDGSSIISPSVVSVPQGLGVFSASFQATQSTSYRLYFHIASTSALAYTMKLDNLSVGPQQELIGTAISAWQNYVPNLYHGSYPAITLDNTSVGSLGSSAAQWRRVGDSIEITGTLNVHGTGRRTSADGIMVSLPTGLTVKSGLNSSDRPFGLWGKVYGGGNFFSDFSIAPIAGSNIIEFDQGSISPTNQFTNFKWSDLSSTPSDNDVLSYTVTVAVSEYTTEAVLRTGIQEFVYNSGNVTAAGATDSTSFGSGAAGTPILAYNSSSATPNSTNFLCRFQTPIQPTDVIRLEVQKGANAPWEDMNMGAPYSLANQAEYGARIDPVVSSATDITVSFMNSGKSAVNVASYGGNNGDTWASALAAGWRWRVRKASGPVAIEATSGTQAIAVSDWQTYTPTMTAIGTPTTLSFVYRRVGDSVDINGTFTAGTTSGAVASFTLPPGLSIDYTKLGLAGFVGSWALNQVRTDAKSLIPYQSNQVAFGSGTSGELNNPMAGSSLVSTGQVISVRATLPIINWDSVVAIDQVREEFAFNSNIATNLGAGQTDNSSFAYGSIGARFGSFNSTTASSSTSRIVRFKNAIQASDIVTLEISQDGGTTWASAGNTAYGFTSQGNFAYGMSVYHSVGNTDVTINFANGGASAQNLTYGTAGQSWSILAGDSNFFWRLRKSSGPAIVQANPGYLAAISDWINSGPILLTSTGTNPTKGTTSTDRFLWRQVGDSMQVQIEYDQSAGGSDGSGMYLIQLPSGYTIDSTKTLLDTSLVERNRDLGSVVCRANTVNYTGFVQAYDSTHVKVYLNTAGTAADWGGTGASFTAGLSNNPFQIAAEFTVPIATWTSNVQVVNTSSEYAWNSGTVTSAGGTDTTSFGNGPAGTRFQAINSTTVGTVTAFTVQFQQPIQSSDLVVLEFSQDGGTTWCPSGETSLGYVAQGSWAYGMWTYHSVGTNQVIINFANGGASSQNATYANPGQAWSNLSSDPNSFWRVRKTAGAALVGINADQIGKAMSNVGADAIGQAMSTVGTNAIATTMNATGANLIANKITASGADSILGQVDTASTSYTPTISVNAGTVTSPLASGSYYKIGKWVHVSAQGSWTPGISGTATQFFVSLPFNIATLSGQHAYCIVQVQNTPTNLGNSPCFLIGIADTTLSGSQLNIYFSNKLLGSITGFSHGDSPQFAFTFAYLIG